MTVRRRKSALGRGRLSVWKGKSLRTWGRLSVRWGVGEERVIDELRDDGVRVEVPLRRAQRKAWG
jgi:hypothetical protein